MNVFDLAKQLAETIKQCDEYVNYKLAKEKVYSSEECKEILEDIKERMMDIQLISMQGGTIEPEKLDEYEDLQNQAMHNESIRDYYDKELIFEEFMADISNTISENVEL